MWFEDIFPAMRDLKRRSPASRAVTPTSSRSRRTSRSRCRRSRPCLDLSGPRNRIVLSELDFPTDGHVWLAQPGAELVWLRRADGLTIDLEAYRDAIDERTALVMVNRVLYRSSAIMDAKAVCTMAREGGALSFVDDYHGAGIVPLDLHDLGCDLYSAGMLKFLCGGPGCAFLYADATSSDAGARGHRVVRDGGAVLVRHRAPDVPPDRAPLGARNAAGARLLHRPGRDRRRRRGRRRADPPATVASSRNGSSSMPTSWAWPVRTPREPPGSRRGRQRAGRPGRRADLPRAARARRLHGLPRRRAARSARTSSRTRTTSIVASPSSRRSFGRGDQRPERTVTGTRWTALFSNP